MFAKHDLLILWKWIRPTLTRPGSMKVIAAVVVAGVSAAVITTLPESEAESSDTSRASQAASLPNQKPASALVASCETQAWPYIDQRCAESADAARGTRQVRVVTDRGTSLTMVTPVPIVEPKPTPAPKPQTVAKAETPLGPPVIPAPPEAALQDSVAAESFVPQLDLAPTTLSQAQATFAPPPQLPGPAKSRQRPIKSLAQNSPSALPTEQASTEKREAKRTSRERDDKPVPAEVIAAVKAASAEVPAMRGRGATETAAPRQGNAAAEPPPARAREYQGVPAEVIAAVEKAAGRSRSYDGGQRVILSERRGPAGEVVTIGSPGRPAQRIHVVPSEDVEYIGGAW